MLIHPKQRKRIWIFGALLFIAGGILFLQERFALFGTRLTPGETTSSVNPDFIIEEVARGLTVPWSIAFTSKDRMLVTERPGRIRVIEQGKLQPEPLYTFTDVSTGGEQGLMSLALDPDYQNNKYFYTSVAYEQGKSIFVKIVRLTDQGSAAIDEKIIWSEILAAENHAGSRIAFGPDKKLYITTGDATERGLAQDTAVLPGKILRINTDGSVPEDNPFPGSPVWSYGHRNPQGLAWDATGQLFSTEHGPSVFDGPAGGDEVNRIEKGGNYGWPLVSHTKKKEGTIAPLITFTPAEAPASLLIYSGKVFPEWRGNLFFGALKGKGLVRLVLHGNELAIAETEKLEQVQFGRIREVAEGPDGFIYFSTSNRDGRGNPAQADDRIFRIRPL